MCWRTIMPYLFDFLFWWIDKLDTLPGLQWGFRVFPWHSSIDQGSHKIPSTWEEVFTELYLEAGQKQIRTWTWQKGINAIRVPNLHLGFSTISFILLWSQAKTEPCFCWLWGHLRRWCFSMMDQLPRICLTYQPWGLPDSCTYHLLTC